MDRAFKESEAPSIWEAFENLKRAKADWKQIQEDFLFPACKKAMLERLDYTEDQITSAKVSYNTLFKVYEGEVVVNQHRFVFEFTIHHDGEIVVTFRFGENW